MPKMSDLNIENDILWTGIKVIDFFVPLSKGSKMGLLGGAGVGKTEMVKMLVRSGKKCIMVMPFTSTIKAKVESDENWYYSYGSRRVRLDSDCMGLSMTIDKFSHMNLMDIKTAGFDYIFIDCPPSLGILTTNALGAADSVLIPVQCEYFALEGIMQLINTIMLAQKKVNPNLDIEGVLLTMLTTNTNLGLEVVDSIKGFFKERVYDTIIPRLIRLAEAPSHGKPILEYEPRSRGTLAYLNLAKEVIEKNGTKKESVG